MIDLGMFKKILIKVYYEFVENTCSYTKGANRYCVCRL